MDEGRSTTEGGCVEASSIQAQNQMLLVSEFPCSLLSVTMEIAKIWEWIVRTFETSAKNQQD